MTLACVKLTFKYPPQTPMTHLPGISHCDSRRVEWGCGQFSFKLWVIIPRIPIDLHDEVLTGLILLSYRQALALCIHLLWTPSAHLSDPGQAWQSNTEKLWSPHSRVQYESGEKNAYWHFLFLISSCEHGFVTQGAVDSLFFFHQGLPSPAVFRPGLITISFTWQRKISWHQSFCFSPGEKSCLHTFSVEVAVYLISKNTIKQQGKPWLIFQTISITWRGSFLYALRVKIKAIISFPENRMMLGQGVRKRIAPQLL